MAEENETGIVMIEHEITINEIMSVNLKIPKKMNMLSFKETIENANRLFNINNPSEQKIEQKEYTPKEYVPKEYVPKECIQKPKKSFTASEREDYVIKLFKNNASYKKIAEKSGLKLTTIGDYLMKLRRKGLIGRRRDKTISKESKELKKSKETPIQKPVDLEFWNTNGRKEQFFKEYWSRVNDHSKITGKDLKQLKVMFGTSMDNIFYVWKEFKEELMQYANEHKITKPIVKEPVVETVEEPVKETVEEPVTE